MDYKKEYEKWLSCDAFDRETKEELKNLTDEKEIEDRFYKDLSFGTGGLRGVIGAGNNRMNDYTVGRATKGLSNYLIKHGGKSVAIAYDSRNKSDAFALRAAGVFAANGIKAYLFDSLRPTPELSFALKKLGASTGVVITASHNPPEYNGYKVYNSDGGQIVPPEDKLIIDEVNKISVYEKIDCLSVSDAEEQGLIEFVGEDIDAAFIGEIKKLALNPDTIKKYANKLTVVYTPLHGAGNIPVRRVLTELGVKNVYVVKEQEEPDGNFTTLKSPNPEDPAAFNYALKLAEKVNADVVIATDPDSDRLGVCIPDGKGKYRLLSGNESGALIGEYIVSEKARKGLLPISRKSGALVSTVVSSKIGEKIAEKYGLTYFETLTGFKYIGEKIKQFETKKEKFGGYSAENGAFDYVFGFEESFGCLCGKHARDKDAVSAAAILVEIAAVCKSRGETLKDRVDRIYGEYGYFKETLFSATLKGADGAKIISGKMENLRSRLLTEIAGFKVLAMRDYKTRKRTDEFGKVSDISLPESNMVYFEIEGGWCAIRPSGTEPKIKFYAGVLGNSYIDAQEKLDRLVKGLKVFAEN